ncbi:calcium release-activated calcium channel protein 1-like [Watersipora subatra]|uniref:calcium release-activated calcium channel protein 1-like n=1 Tax=Watersipora subatra TaxID=2589382 RepID=UPI00355B4335
MLPDQGGNVSSTTAFMSPNLIAWRQLYLNKAKLKAVSRTSALLSGFAMIGMVEINLDKEVDGTILMFYAINTTLLIAVHLLALMISTCILPNIESVSATMSSVKDSPHQSMNVHIQMAWAFSTVLGILLFFFEVALLCWVKLQPLDRRDCFYSTTMSITPLNLDTSSYSPSEMTTSIKTTNCGHKGRNAAIASTCIVVPAAIAFLWFACHFYRRLADHKFDRTNRNMVELENIHSGLQDV